MRFEPSIKFPYPWRMVTSALWCRLGLRSNSPFQLPPLCLYPHPHQTPHSFQLCSKRAFHTGVLARLSCWDTERDIKVTVLENSRYTLIGPDQTRSSLSALSLLSNQKQQQQQEKAQSEWNLAEQTLVYGIEARSPGGEDLCTVQSYLTPARGGELTLSAVHLDFLSAKEKGSLSTIPASTGASQTPCPSQTGDFPTSNLFSPHYIDSY